MKSFTDPDHLRKLKGIPVTTADYYDPDDTDLRDADIHLSPEDLAELLEDI
jgi:hypothetical protein